MSRQFTRKAFLKGAAAGALSIAALGVTGVSAAEAAPAGKGFVPGIYEGVGAGRNGDIRVSVEMSESAIVSIQVNSHQETPALSDNAFKILPAKMVLTQNIYCDGISGATMTSTGLTLRSRMQFPKPVTRMS